MTNAARHIAGLEDLESVPDAMIGELLAGELLVSPRPSPRHGYAQHGLDNEVTGPFQKGRGGPGGWLFLCEPELHLGGDALVPDLAGWRRERLPFLSDESSISVAPDWVCEVLSPRTEARDRGAKAKAYAREGVRHYWLCNPLLRTLEIWRLQGELWVVVDVFEGDRPVRAEPFEAAPITLGELWAPEGP